MNAILTDDEISNNKSHGGAVTAKLPNRTSFTKSLSSIAHFPDAHKASDQLEDNGESRYNSDTWPTSSMNASNKEGNNSSIKGNNFFLNKGSNEDDELYFSRDFETLSEKIDYINEKQQVLTCVSGLLMWSDDDVYDASLA